MLVNKIFGQSAIIPIFVYVSIDIILIYIAWWITLLVLSFVLGDILVRLGILISINIAFTLLPVTRNSLWITYLKISYNKLIIFHKLIAILTLVSVIIKCGVILYMNNISFLFTDLNASMGTICSLSILLTSILSLPYIRKNMFELFYYSLKVLFFLTFLLISFFFFIF